MNEFFADTIDIWTFNLLDKKFHLIINNSYNQFWREFFQDLEAGQDLKDSKLNLFKKILKSKLQDENTVEMYMEKFPDYFQGNTNNNLDKLENDSEFQSVLREIKIKKIID